MVKNILAIRAWHRPAGFSLVEVLAAMAVLVMIVLMISQVFTGVSQAFSQGMITTEQGSAGRSALNFMVAELQGAMCDDRVPIKIAYDTEGSALKGELTFLTQNVFMKPGGSTQRRSAQVVKYGLYSYPGSATDPKRWQLWRNFEDDKIKVSEVYVDGTLPDLPFEQESGSGSQGGLLLDNVCGLKIVAITASGERFEEGIFGSLDKEGNQPDKDPAVALEIYLEVLGQEYTARVGVQNRAKAELLNSRYFTRVNLLNAVGHRYDNMKVEAVEAVEVVP
jgi:prepilin-type N-terminal cleavage/methylation domain-containing protein